MNLIRWIVSTVFTALLLPQLPGLGPSAPGPSPVEQRLAVLADQARDEQAAATESFFVLDREAMAQLLEGGLESLEPLLVTAQKVQRAAQAASGPALAPTGVKVLRVTYELVVPELESRVD
jgi:hypothetical protein